MTRAGLIVLVAGTVLATAGHLHAATTFVVNTTDGTADGICDAVHCSLSDAIAAANALAGADRIEFDILPHGPAAVLAGTNMVATRGR